MTILNLSNQRSQVEAALPTFQAFKTQMELRREIWSKLSQEQRKNWIQSSNDTLTNAKDPVIWLALNLKQFIDSWEIE